MNTITPRDREICRMLYEHRVLTTEHLADLYFDSARRARRRLQILRQRKVVDRFRRYRPTGSFPYHWVLGDTGVQVVAAERAVDPRQIRHRKDRALAYELSPRLAHLVDTNGLFCRLARACRERVDLHLSDWWPETRCADAWGGLVRPDGLGIVDNGAERRSFCLELDRGTESGAQLEEKLAAYARISRLPDAPTLLLVVFPTERREAEARRHLRNAGLLIVTATLSAAMNDPLGNVWLPIDGERRVGIAALLFGDADE